MREAIKPGVGGLVGTVVATWGRAGVWREIPAVRGSDGFSVPPAVGRG